MTFKWTPRWPVFSIVCLQCLSVLPRYPLWNIIVMFRRKWTRAKEEKHYLVSISDRRRTHGRGNLRASVLFFSPSSSSTHLSADLRLTALFFEAHSRRHLATTTPPSSTLQYSHERASSDRTRVWVFSLIFLVEGSWDVLLVGSFCVFFADGWCLPGSFFFCVFSRNMYSV